MASPMRLSDNLVKVAKSVGARYKRSPPNQIEYWAELGRHVEALIDPDCVVAIREGLATLEIKPVPSSPISSKDVMADLKQQQSDGSLAANVSNAVIRYQISSTHPGYLEQLLPDGSRCTGRFINGEFIPLNP